MLPSQNGQILSKLQFISYYSQTKIPKAINHQQKPPPLCWPIKQKGTSEIASYLNWPEHKGDFNENSWKICYHLMRFVISIKSCTYECLINLLVGLLRHHRSPGLICIISQFYCVTSLGTISREPSPSLALTHSHPVWHEHRISYVLLMYIQPLLSGAFCKVLWKFYMQYNVIKKSWECLEGLSYDFPTSYNFLFRIFII